MVSTITITVQDPGILAEPLLSCPSGESPTMPISSIAGVGKDGLVIFGLLKTQWQSTFFQVS